MTTNENTKNIDAYEFGPFTLKLQPQSTVLPAVLYKLNQKTNVTEEVPGFRGAKQACKLLVYLIENRERAIETSVAIKHFWGTSKAGKNLGQEVTKLRVFLEDTEPWRYIDRGGRRLQFIYPEVRIHYRHDIGQEPSVTRAANLALPLDGSYGTSQRQLWNIPPRNPLFTSREDYLEIIYRTLTNNSSTAGGHPIAISGLGGVGKTQAAIQYAHRFRDHYAAALWVTAESRDSLISGYLLLADLLEVPGRDNRDTGRIADIVRRWFATHSDWLLILDNVEDLNILRAFLPEGAGHCLITTRLPATYGVIGTSVPLTSFELPEAALFLLRRAGLLSILSSLEDAPDSDKILAEEIANELGRLPLALDQAGAFIEETPSTLADYLRYYRAEGARLRAEHSEFSEEHAPVTATFTIALSRAENRNHASADIVRAAAFLGSDAIPEELFAESAVHLGDQIVTLLERPSGLTEALKTAARFALIHRNRTDGTINIHRMVQEVVKDGMDSSTRRVWVERVLHALDTVFPLPTRFENWFKCERVLRHSIGVAHLIEHYKLTSVVASHFLNNLGVYLLLRGEYTEARPLLERALTIREKELGSLHPETANTINNLAWLYHDEGRYSDADLLYERALAITEATMGPGHPYTACIIHNLVMLQRDRLSYGDEIVSCRKRILLGVSTKMQSAFCLVNESVWSLFDRGLEEEAITLCQNALSKSEIARGFENPETADILHSLGLIYLAQGRYGDAHLQCERALTIREKELGSLHPETADILHSLGLIYLAQGRYGDAHLQCERARFIAERRLGPEHPFVGTVLATQAQLLRNAGNGAEAAALEVRVQDIQHKEQRDVSGEVRRIMNLIRKTDLNERVQYTIGRELRQQGLTDSVRELIQRSCTQEIKEVEAGIKEANELLGKKALQKDYGEDDLRSASEAPLRRGSEPETDEATSLSIIE